MNIQELSPNDFQIKKIESRTGIHNYACIARQGICLVLFYSPTRECISAKQNFDKLSKEYSTGCQYYTVNFGIQENLKIIPMFKQCVNAITYYPDILAFNNHMPINRMNPSAINRGEYKDMQTFLSEIETLTNMKSQSSTAAPSCMRKVCKNGVCEYKSCNQVDDYAKSKILKYTLQKRAAPCNLANNKNKCYACVNGVCRTDTAVTVSPHGDTGYLMLTEKLVNDIKIKNLQRKPQQPTDL